MTDPQDDIRHLLPFWVNGTLTAAEKARVSAAMTPELQQEIDVLAAMRDQMQATTTPHGPGDLGLARLMRAIDADASRAAAASWSGFGRLAASVAVAAMLASALTYAMIKPGQDAEVVFEQASGDDPATVLTVSFRPDATEAAISALLREKGLVIVDGPSAVGLYRIAFPYDTTAPEAARYLADATAVVATVEQAE